MMPKDLAETISQSWALGVHTIEICGHIAFYKLHCLVSSLIYCHAGLMELMGH